MQYESTFNAIDNILRNEAGCSTELDDIKDILAHTSRNDEFTASNPIRWGYGKIDAAAGIEYLKNSTAITEIPAEQPQQAEDTPWYDITGRTYPTQPTAPGIYIHAGKKYVVY